MTVIDNASLQEVRPEIESHARKNDCIFKQLPSPGIQHHEFIQNTIKASAKDQSLDGPLVFLDPDLSFWDCCENFAFEGLMAGRLFGKFFDHMAQAIAMPRLHTSFLWIQDVNRLVDEIEKIKSRHFDFEPFTPYSCILDGAWYRFDTGASLYAAISNKASYFTEEHFNCYDHLYCGSHFDWLFPLYDPESQKMMSKIHNCAKNGNYQSLRGVWRYQRAVWRKSFPLQT